MDFVCNYVACLLMAWDTFLMDVGLLLYMFGIILGHVWDMSDIMLGHVWDMSGVIFG